MWPLVKGEDSVEMLRVRCSRCGSTGVTEKYDECTCWRCGGKVFLDFYRDVLLVEEEFEEPSWKWVLRKWFT